MEKAKLTQKQADALEIAMKLPGYPTKSHLLRAHANHQTPWLSECEPLNDIDLMTLAQALVNGYEVEQTPEDKVREYFDGLNRKVIERAREMKAECIRTYETCEIVGIIQTLNLLGIKIEGVNT